MSEITDGYKFDHWLTVDEALECLKPRITTRQGVTRLCRLGKLRASLIGIQGRGEWRIDPAQFGKTTKR